MQGASACPALDRRLRWYAIPRIGPALKGVFDDAELLEGAGVLACFEQVDVFGEGFAEVGTGGEPARHVGAADVVGHLLLECGEAAVRDRAAAGSCTGNAAGPGGTDVVTQPREAMARRERRVDGRRGRIRSRTAARAKCGGRREQDEGQGAGQLSDPALELLTRS